MSNTSKQAMGFYAACLAKLNKNVTPAGQKFRIGTRVRIADNPVGHFSGYNATVKYTYAQMYGGTNTHSYCIDIDNIGEVSWYEENQLTLINKD